MRSLRTGVAALAAVCTFALTAAPAAAQFVWTQPLTGTTANWSDGPWSPSTPTSGTTTGLMFNVLTGSASAFTFTNTLGSFTVNSLVVDNSSTNLLTLALPAGNGLTLDGTNPLVAIRGAGNVTLSGAGGITLTGPTAFGGGGNGTLTVAAAVGGTGGVTIDRTGNGVVALTGTNTFTGGVALNAGVLSVAADAGFGDAANGLTFGGGTLRATTALTTARTLSFAGAGTIAGTVNTTLSTGSLTGSGALTKLESGSLILQSANAGYTGAVTVGALGPVVVGSTLVTNSATIGGITLNTGGTLNNASGITLNNNQALAVVRGTSTLTAADRLGTVPLTLHGGILTYSPGSAAADSSTLGSVTLGSGLNTFRTAAAAGSATGTELNFGTLTRANNATLHFGLNTSGNGQIGGAPAAATLNLRFANLSDIGTNAGGFRNVVPWASGLNGVGSSFALGLMTYDTNGFRLLSGGETTIFTAAANLTSANANQNIDNRATLTLTENVTINSFSQASTTGTPGIAGAFTLTVSSGAVQHYNALTVTNTTIAFGSATGYIHQGDNATFAGTANITGSGGVVISSHSTLNYRTTFNAANTFTGGLYLNGRQTAAATVTAGVNFTADNQLGAAGEALVINGGQLNFTNTTTDASLGTRPITLTGPGVFTVGTAARTLTVPGVVSGPGSLIVNGPGTVALTGAANNTYSGGTNVTGGVLSATAATQLGTGPVFLGGGTLRAAGSLAIGGAGTPAGLTVTAASTLDTQANAVTLGAPLASTANVALTKAGSGTLGLTAASPRMSGSLAVAGGNVVLSGAGALPQASAVTLSAGTALTLDNSGTYVSDRLADTGTLNLNGGLFTYTAPTTSVTGPAERFGRLIVGGADGVLNVSAAGATSPIELRFAALTVSSGSLTVRGTDLGGTTGHFTRVLFDLAPVAVSGDLIPNVFFANTAGTGISTAAAVYDFTRGVMAFTPPAQTGTTIDNYTPTSTNNLAAFTTTGNATANTGARVFSLTLDGGDSLTLNDGANGPDATNGNTPTGTLRVAGGTVTSQNGAKSILAGSGGAAKVLDFGTAAANVTTTSDLTIGPGVAVTGTGGFAKNGTGTLTLDGTFGVTGAFAVNAGTVRTDAPLTVGTLSGTGTIALNTAGALTVNQTAASTFAGAVTGGTTLTKSGTGNLTLALSAAPTYAGGTTVGNGTLTLGNAATAAAVLGNFTLGSAAGNTSGVLDLNGFSPAAPVTAIAIAGTGTGSAIVNSNADVSTVSLNLPADSSLALRFGGNVLVNKNDSTTLTLTGGGTVPASTAGEFRVNSGILRLTAGNQGLGAGVGVTVASGATFRLTGNSTNNFASPFGTITLNGGTLENNGASFFDPYFQAMVLTGGTVSSTSGSASGSWYHFLGPAGLTVTASGTTSMVTSTNADDRFMNSTAAPLPVTVAAGTTAAGVDLMTGINFSSGGSNPNFVKQGAGIWAVTNTNNTGNLQVAAGTLRMEGRTSGTITVNGGKLSVFNNAAPANGAVTVNSGGTLSVGPLDSASGGVNLTASVTLGNNAVLEVPVAITGADRTLALTGTFNTSSASDSLVLVLAGSELFAPGMAYTNGGAGYTLVTFSTAGANLPQGTFSFASPGRFAIPGTSAWSLTVDANALVVTTFTPVPEPAGVLAAVAGLGLAGWVRRRRPAGV